MQSLLLAPLLKEQLTLTETEYFSSGISLTDIFSALALRHWSVGVTKSSLCYGAWFLENSHALLLARH